MKNLKIWQKLAVMGVVFMIPFAVVTSTMVSSINKLGIDFARQESRGVIYARPVLALLKELQEHRGMASAWLAGDAAFKERLAAKRADIDRQLGAIDGVDAQLDEYLHLSKAWQTVRANTTALLDVVSQLTVDESFQRHTVMIADVIAHIQAVSDASNLTLDPDLDSYYLMSATMFQGPELTEALGQARGLGSRVLTARNVPPEVIERFKELPPHVDYLGQQFVRSFEKSLAANSTLQELQDLGNSSVTALREAVPMIKRTAAGRAGDTSAAEYFERITGSSDTIFEAKAQALTVLDQLLVRRIDRFHREITVTLLAAGFGLLVVWLIGLFLMLDVTRPLRRVVGIADRIAEGDLAVELSQSQSRRDEIGELARSFDRMVAFLREMVHVTEEIAGGNLTVKVKPQSQRDALGNALAAMVTNLSALVGQVQKSGIQVNSSVNQIAATAKQQQATATEIAATTMEVGATSKQISATSKELVKSVGEVSKVADQSAALAGSSQAGLTHMEETMRQVVEAAGAINAKLAVLNEKAGNISQVVTTITKVADQTNLLSLNAAIEAEKAGEYGRGFSVVATEIRRLADQTAVATYDIEQMVKEIQSAVAAGVMGMDKFSEDVRRGMQDVQQVGGQLTQIIQQVQTLAPRFEDVNEGMQAQATGAEQITQALGQLNEAAQQTVESLRQSTEAIEGLNDVAGGLRSGVARFKVAAA